MMQRIDATTLLWSGLMIWAFGHAMLLIGFIVDRGSSDGFGYAIYEAASAIGGFVLFIGAACKVIARLRNG